MRLRPDRRLRGIFSALTVALLAIGLFAGCATSAERRPLVMGAADTSAMRVMAQIYAAVLRGAGAPVSPQLSLGDDQALLERAQEGEIDLFPAFTGALLTHLAPVLTPPPAAEQTPPAGAEQEFDPIYRDLNRALPQGMSVGDTTPVVQTPRLLVATSLAAASDVSDLSGCARLPADLPVMVAEPPAAATLRAFADAGCRLGPIEVQSAVRGVLDRVATGNALGVLTPLQLAGDPTTTQLGDQVRVLAGEHPVAGPAAEVLVPVYRTVSLSRAQVKAVNRVAGEITTVDLATMAREVDGGADPATVALDWVTEHGV